MKKLLLFFVPVLALMAQGPATGITPVATAPSGTCVAGDLKQLITGGGGLYYCPFATHTWTLLTSTGSGIPYPGAGIANSTGTAWGTSFAAGGTGPNIPTQPASVTSGDLPSYSNSSGQLTDSGKVAANLVSTTDTGTVTNAMLAGSISNSKLVNSATTVNNQSCTLGTSCTIPLSAVTAQTATYQTLAADFSNYKTISISSGTFTVTLVASGSQPSAGQYIHIINYGTGVITIARSGQNLNGGTGSLTLNAGSATAPSSAFVQSDGTNYVASSSNPSTGGSGTSPTTNNQTATTYTFGTNASDCYGSYINRLNTTSLTDTAGTQALGCIFTVINQSTYLTDSIGFPSGTASINSQSGITTFNLVAGQSVTLASLGSGNWVGISTVNYVSTLGVAQTLNGTYSFVGELIASVPLTFKVGISIAAASTIAPSTPIVHITGTTAIATMTPPYNCTVSGNGCEVRLIPDAAFTTTAGTAAGQFKTATTAVVGKALIEVFDNATSLWYPSY